MKKHLLFILTLFMAGGLHAQLLMNNGALIHVQADARLYVVNGDVLVTTNGANHGIVDNYGHIEVRNGDLSATNANTVIHNRDSMDIRGDVSLGSDVSLQLHAGSGMRVTNDFAAEPGTFTADIASLVHFDGDYHTGGPAVQNVRTGMDGISVLAFYPSAAPTVNAFGNVRLTTPGLALDPVEGSSLVVHGSLDFSDEPSFINATYSGEAPATNSNSTNVITNTNSLGGLVMAGTADYNIIGTSTLSILDEPGAGTADPKHERDYVVATIVQYTNPGTSYIFPLGGTLNSVECLQAMRLNFSVAPSASDIVRIMGTWSVTPMADISATHCISPGTPAAEQWTGTWGWIPFDNIGFPVFAATGGLTYNVSLRTVNAAPVGAVGTGIKHTLDTDPAVVNCAASAYDLSSTLPQSLFSEGGGYHIPVPPMPVEQLAIRATPVGDYIRVDWNTSAETNSSHYDLQRSLNGVDFNTIVSDIPAAGTTQQRSEYTRPDFAVQRSTLYHYRVVQYDHDGANTISPVVQAMLTDGVARFSAGLYPNPANEQLNLKVYAPQATMANLVLYDNLGKRIHQQRVYLAGGDQVVDLTPVLKTVADGQYALVLQAGSFHWQEKLIKLKD
ncbi:MAG: T9SS type A sorting domain-containing protein [Bacteroidetes bacterium]|nr:T9SS type A sorting domain-containing protein [Bacteroidota bacterium]